MAPSSFGLGLVSLVSAAAAAGLFGQAAGLGTGAAKRRVRIDGRQFVLADTNASIVLAGWVIHLL